MVSKTINHVSSIIPSMISELRNKMYIAWYDLFKRHNGDLNKISKETGYDISKVKKTLISLGIISA